MRKKLIEKKLYAFYIRHGKYKIKKNKIICIENRRKKLFYTEEK